MTPEQLKALNEKIGTLSTLVENGRREDAETIKSLRDEIAELKSQGVEVATNVGTLKATLHDHDEWKSTLERRIDNMRYGPSGGADALKSAIPERMQPMINRFMRRGKNSPLITASGRPVDSGSDAVQMAAIEAWFKIESRLQTKYGMDQRAALLEERDKLELALNGGVKVDKAAFAEGAAATGGNVVPAPVEAMILRVAEDASVVRGLARIMPMSVVTHNIPNDAGGITVAKVSEAGAVGESEPTFGSKALTAEMIAVRGLASLQVLQDANIGLLDYWVLRASEAYGLYEDAQALEGDGTDFTGLSDASNVNEVLQDISGTTTNGGPPTYDRCADAIYKAGKRSTRQANRGTAWVMHPTVLGKIVGKVDSNGAPIFHRQDVARVLSANIVGPGFGEGTLLGYPVWTSDQISIARTKGSLSTASFAYFGPFQDGVIIGDLLGLNFMVSEHVAFNNAQLAMRMLKRTAILVGNPAAMTKWTGIDAS